MSVYWRCSGTRRLKAFGYGLVEVGKGHCLRSTDLGFGWSWGCQVVGSARTHEARLLIIVAFRRGVVVVEGIARRLRLHGIVAVKDGGCVCVATAAVVWL